jgi:pentatricopeptide repeat protein
MAQPAPEEAPAADRMAPHEPLHAPKPSPRPKSSFSSWVAQFQPPDIQTQLSEIMESKKMEDNRMTRKNKKKGHPNSKVDEIVLQSITENGNLVSETLAKVLAQQGQYEKAEEMYRRLMLVFPEKSDYFAQQILNIKSD